mmetsp:Transcript_30068/g.87583  ORF Transcript_30068/g.87583 Transcript_30068/m.87583 type:complete len:379 (-) Transcript_30068:1358-2494(-)
MGEAAAEGIVGPVEFRVGLLEEEDPELFPYPRREHRTTACMAREVIVHGDLAPGAILEELHPVNALWRELRCEKEAPDHVGLLRHRGKGAHEPAVPESALFDVSWLDEGLHVRRRGPRRHLEHFGVLLVEVRSPFPHHSPRRVVRVHRSRHGLLHGCEGQIYEPVVLASALHGCNNLGERVHPGVHPPRAFNVSLPCHVLVDLCLVQRSSHGPHDLGRGHRPGHGHFQPVARVGVLLSDLRDHGSLEGRELATELEALTAPASGTGGEFSAGHEALRAVAVQGEIQVHGVRNLHDESERGSSIASSREGLAVQVDQRVQGPFFPLSHVEAVLVLCGIAAVSPPPQELSQVHGLRCVLVNGPENLPDFRCRVLLAHVLE